jgi:glycerol-3-phosphate O-acyltransferase
VRVTAALLADLGSFSESISFMLGSDLLKSAKDARGEVIYFEESRRRALDLYRNSIVHYLATPSLLARRLIVGGTLKELRADLATWQEVLYQEFYVPRGEVLAAHAEGFLDHFEALGWIERNDDVLFSTARGEGILGCLVAQTQGVLECYEAACQVLLHVEGHITKREYLAQVKEAFERSQLLGTAQRTEAANDTTFSNALDLMLRREILCAEKLPRRSGPSDLQFAPGESWLALRELRERLAAAVSAR